MKILLSIVSGLLIVSAVSGFGLTLEKDGENLWVCTSLQELDYQMKARIEANKYFLQLYTDKKVELAAAEPKDDSAIKENDRLLEIYSDSTRILNSPNRIYIFHHQNIEKAADCAKDTSKFKSDWGKSFTLTDDSIKAGVTIEDNMNNNWCVSDENNRKTNLGGEKGVTRSFYTDYPAKGYRIITGGITVGSVCDFTVKITLPCIDAFSSSESQTAEDYRKMTASEWDQLRLII